MKILIVSQRFWPEQFRINDIAKSLIEKNNEITVITGLPMYPGGHIYDGYKKGFLNTDNFSGIDIIRVKEHERKKGLFNRFLNYYSFSYYGKKAVKKIDKNFDVVLINELSPIICSNPAIKYAKKNHKKIVMYEMDLWPESLLAGGVTKKSLIYKYYKKVSSRIYSQCSKILVSTFEHINYIKNLPGCSDLDIEYLPQYSEKQFEDIPLKHFDELTRINLLFAGNIGKAQSIDTIIKAANILKDDNKFVFHIVGIGSEYEKAINLAKSLQLKNLIFYGQKTLEEMVDFYNMADAAIVTLEDVSYANMTIPGKVQSYIAAGKPIIGAANGATKNLIMENNIGQCCNSKDYVAMADIIKNLDVNAFNEYSLNAKKLYQKEFCREKFIEKLILELERMK